MTIAAIRPDSWDLPLLLHVAGAMILVASLAVALALLVLSWRREAAGPVWLVFRMLLFGALPAFVVMRATAEWILDKENVPDDATWTGIGFTVSDASLVLLIVATVLCGLLLRRLRRAGGGPGALAGVATALISLTILGYGVAIWAMTTKPGA